MYSTIDWKIHKKLGEAGGIGPIIYILQARGNGKLHKQRELEDKFLASGRKVVYVQPDKNRQRGFTLAGAIIDLDILTPERCERAERIWNEYWKERRDENVSR